MTSLSEISTLNLKNCSITSTSLGLLLRSLTNLKIRKLILDENQLNHKNTVEYFLNYLKIVGKGKVECISLKGCGIEYVSMSRIDLLAKKLGIKVIG